MIPMFFHLALGLVSAPNQVRNTFECGSVITTQAPSFRQEIHLEAVVFEQFSV